MPTFLAGEGEATVGDEVVAVSPGVPHAFRPTGPAPLRLLVVFPGPRFAETTILEEPEG